MVEYILIAVVVVLLLIFMSLYLRKNKRVKTALEIQAKELAEQRDIIAKSLEEKEVLLKEIHHRVKNNLQLVSSLMQLQSNKFKDPQVILALEEGQGRVQSMAMIHQMLYEHENLEEIDLEIYFKDLSDSIRTVFTEAAQNVEWHQETGNMMVNIDTAVPLGLIANELIYNCFKYAFADQDNGRIDLKITKNEDGNYCMTISDNGKGLPENFKDRKKVSLGMRLVEALSRQLDGRVEFGNKEKGTEVKVNFRLDWSE